MAKEENKQSTLRDLEKQMEAFVAKYGTQPLDVFSGLLDYIIAGLDPMRKPLEGWHYNAEQNKLFFDMMQTAFEVIMNECDKEGWYDAFGDMFMESIGKTSAQYKGQFFTPSSLCKAIARTALPEVEPEAHTKTTFGKRVCISDCACGSGRNLLAAHDIFMNRNWKAPYLCGEDIDHLCVNMTAINMCVHGGIGEVICHDTLQEPDKVRFGYIINEGMYPLQPGFLTIRYSENPLSFMMTSRQISKKMESEGVAKKNPFHNERAKIATPPPPKTAVEKLTEMAIETPPKKEPIQLSLF